MLRLPIDAPHRGRAYNRVVDAPMVRLPHTVTRRNKAYCMSQHPLTDEELIELREFLKVATEVKKESEFRAAKKLVYQTYKQVVIGLAGLAAAGILLSEQIKNFFKGLIQ